MAFQRNLAPAVLAAIQSSPWSSVDFETTALSLSSPPTRVGSGQMVGDEYTSAAYQRHFGAGLDCRPRARVWSVLISSGEMWAFDLDHLGAEETAQLLHASLDGKEVIGHNLGFDFGWALGLCPDFKPRRVLDTMLMIRCFRHGVPWRLNVMGADEQQTAARRLVETRNEASASLNALCVAYGLPTLDKDYQKPHNWCFKHLSPGHLDYCLGDIGAPVEILKKMTGKMTAEAAIESLFDEDIEHNSSIYRDVYQHAPLALARMHRRGLPLHQPTLEAIRLDREFRVKLLLPELYKHMPAMRDFSAQLSASKLSVTADIKRVLGDYAAAHDCALDEAEDGVPVIQRKRAALKGATKLPGWAVWDDLQRAKKILSLCAEYEAYSLPTQDHTWRRLHPLIGANTVTLRCNSQAPNSQNLLRPDPNPLHSLAEPTITNSPDTGLIHVNSIALPAAAYAGRETIEALAERWDELQFRSIVRAPDGWKVVSVDQAQVELRIAAALAQRAIYEVELALAGEYNAAAWFKDAIRRGQDYDIVLTTGAEGFDGLWDEIAATWRRVKQHGAPLAEVFRRGLDPHLLTGLAMAARDGTVDLGGRTPVEVLSDPATDVKGLKAKLKQHRQNAKPANFGLLYGAQAETLWRLGVTDYGLDWSLEDATSVRALWLEQYADVRLWQLWVQHIHHSGKNNQTMFYRRNRYNKELEIKPYKIRTSRTLGGRPIYTPELREVLNHQDQSTGAEITTRAIVDMPSPAAGYLVNVVHDELIAICPAAEAQAVGAQIQATFVAAMDRVLARWGIPSGADITVGDYWAKD